MNRSKRNHLALLICSLMTIAGCDPSQGLKAISLKTANSETEDKALADEKELQALLDQVIEDTYRNRELNVNEHAAWQILHGVLAYGKDFLIRDNQGKLVRAVDYLAAGGQMKGWTMRPGKFYGQGESRRQGVVAVLESGSGTGQGHADQWIAVLSQCDLPKDWTFKLKQYDREYSLDDMLNQMKQESFEGKEMSWTIIALTQRLDKLGEAWFIDDQTSSPNKSEKNNSENKDNSNFRLPWTIQRILRLETAEEVNASACGGTHRLIGMTMCVNRHKREGGEIKGDWLAAQEVIDKHINLAEKYKLEDGSFSSQYFRRSMYSSDLGKRLETTGHTLEFLSIALTDTELKERWVKRAAIHMCDILNSTKENPLECGKLYHAMHGVILYRERLFGKMDSKFKTWADELLAKEKSQ